MGKSIKIILEYAFDTPSLLCQNNLKNYFVWKKKLLGSVYIAE